MSRNLFLTFLQIVSTNYCIAQYYYYNDRYYATDIVWEISAGAGIMNCLTDVGGINSQGLNALKDFNWHSSQGYYSFCLRASYKEIIAARLELGFGNIKAADSLLSKVEYESRDRFYRNLSFESSIMETQLVFEIYPFNFFSGFTSRFVPYFVLGLGSFRFNPKAKLDGKWYNLQPLRLEGQDFEEYSERKSYRLTQVQLPVGAGVRINLTECLHLQLEWQHHLLFTDYLDDASTTYIDPLLFQKYLLPEQAAIASRLYNRMSEIQPGLVINPGSTRGNKEDRDAYFNIQLKLGWGFRAKYKR